MIELNHIPQQKKFKILLLGDSCIDEYQFGVVERISPEAPVPIFRYLYTEERPGMVLNVKSNLDTLPITVDLFTDLPSRKIRLIDQKTKHHIVRIDRDLQCKEPITFDNYMLEYDAIVISDYNKGVITYDFLDNLESQFSGPIFIDTKKKDLGKIKKCFVKINELERNEATSLCGSERLIVTLGSKGTFYNEQIFESSEVVVSDVCGAGDTFLAVLSYFYLLTGSIASAIPFANKAAAVTVQHFGTYAPRLEEYYET